MKIVLNFDQAKALSGFFFDTARAVLVGSLGFSVGVYGLSLETRIVNIIGGLVLTYACIKVGLDLLESDYE